MKSSPPWLAYVGSRTTRERKAQGLGLSVYRVDNCGVWELAQVVEGLRNPSFLCLHPDQPRLYVVHGDFSEITTFCVGSDGLLTQRSQQSTQGSNPVHLALAPSSRWLLVANYATGSVVSIPVDSSGDLAPLRDVLELPGVPGPHPQQKGSHPHQVCFSPDGRHVMVPDKGLDKVFTLKVDEASGRLDIVSTLTLPPGSGPRHLVFHPSMPQAYLVGELDRTVMTLRVDVERGRLHLLGVSATVPTGVDEGSGAGIVLSCDARRLFVSNRGHDTVATFDVGADGALGEPSWIGTGRTPRFITPHPDHDALVVALEEGHSIAELNGAAFHGLVQTGSPVCVVFRQARMTP